MGTGEYNNHNMEKQEIKINEGSRTDWFVHEVNNATGPIIVLKQVPELEIDPEDGKKILRGFLKNAKRKDLVWSEQGPLKDQEMINFVNKLLRIPWVPRQFDSIIKMRDELFDKINESYK